MRILSLLIFLLSLTLPALAKTYSCQDSSGQMHYSDNLQGLPVECLGKEKVVKPGPIDNLQYVPETKLPDGVERDYQRAVGQAERAERLKAEKSARLRQKAENLQKRYLETKDEMSRARRIWDNQSRQQLKLLKIDLARLVEEKQELQKEVKDQRLARKDRQEIEEILQAIKEK